MCLLLKGLVMTMMLSLMSCIGVFSGFAATYGTPLERDPHAARLAKTVRTATDSSSLVGRSAWKPRYSWRTSWYAPCPCSAQVAGLITAGRREIAGGARPVRRRGIAMTRCPFVCTELPASSSQLSELHPSHSRSGFQGWLRSASRRCKLTP